jgi:nucleotide-binding universal stress UspA family protein
VAANRGLTSPGLGSKVYDGTVTLTEARNLLRSELLAVAATVVPDQSPTVTQDVGPVNQGALSDDRGRESVCTITVETGDPSTPDAEAQISFAAETLEARGWKVEVAPVADGHHHLTARRNGYDLTVDARTADWRLTFTGQTPYVDDL